MNIASEEKAPTFRFATIKHIHMENDAMEKPISTARIL